MQSFFTAWGFSADPFDTRCLEPNEEGEALLVGRDTELLKLSKSLNLTTKWICIDGGIGQGKTSLANVAIYKQMKNYLATGQGRFLIPCTSAIQIDKEKSAESIHRDVMFKVARSILSAKERDILKHCQLSDRAAIDKLFNNPFFSGAGVSFGGFGVESASTPNDIEVYEYRLFEVVDEWLRELDSANGAVVCIIDNLELTDISSAGIAEKIEKLRDSLLTKRGLIWILCGANGSVAGMASTRINAHLKKPALVLSELKCISDIVRKRIEHFGCNAYFPLAEDDLVTLDNVMNHVLRECLGYIGNYCEWISESEENPISDDKKKECFSAWLDFMAEDTRASMSVIDKTKAWGILICGFSKAKFTSSEFAEFGYSQQANFSTDLTRLSELGLVVRSKSLDDGRIPEYCLSPKARLAVYKDIASK